jgi:hypothetical protein
MKRIPLLLLIILLIAGGLLSAQEEDSIFGVILYAEGVELSIFRQGELIRYDLFQDDVLGLPLLQGDMVQTEDNSFVEIQLLPSESVVKVAENTTFEITSIGEQGGGSFELLYGRVRAKVSRLNDNDDFQIRGRSAVAGVRGTDFGFDYVARIGQAITPTTAVYCFEGSVEVAGDPQQLRLGSDGTGEAPGTGVSSSVLISAFEMVDVTESASDSQAFGAEVDPAPRFETRSIAQEITDYWRDNSFKASAVDPKDIETVFPNIKEDLRLAREQAVKAAEKRAFLASGQSLKDFRESQQTVSAQPPAPTREDYPLVEPVGMAGLISEIETVAFQPNGLRVTAAMMGTLGVMAETTGIVFTYYGDELGLDSRFSDNYGPVLMAAGGVSLSIGLLSLIVDLTR